MVDLCNTDQNCCSRDCNYDDEDPVNIDPIMANGAPQKRVCIRRINETGQPISRSKSIGSSSDNSNSQINIIPAEL